MRSRDKIVAVGMAMLLIAGTICAFQVRDAPPGTSDLANILGNPFGLIAIAGIVVVWYGIAKKQ